VSSRKLRFDGWVLDPESGDLERAGSRIRLQEQPVQVLRELIAHAGSVVAREQLIALLWPTGVVDFDTGLNTVIRKLRSALGDTSETPRYVETLPRRGYRFIGTLDPDPEAASAASLTATASGPSPGSAPPLHHLPTAIAESALATVKPMPSGHPPAARNEVNSSKATMTALVRRLRSSSLPVIAALAVAALLAGVYALWRARSAASVTSVRVEAPSQSGLPANVAPTGAVGFAPPPHSIAVLPFVNVSGDKEQEYFSDGLTEELLNSLVHIDGLQVAARTSSFSFREHPDVADVAHKLNVSTVLEGSVRRSARTVRVTAKLISGVTGFHLWSKTYDRDLGDVLKLQTEIATAVATALEVTLLGDEAEKIELGGTRNPTALDAYLRGAKAYTSFHDGEDIKAAIAAYTEAIRLDPNYALAFASRSPAYLSYASQFTTGAAIRESVDKAEEDAHQAIKLAPDLAEGHVALARYLEKGSLDFMHASEAYERALALAPGNATVLDNYGRAAANMGRAEAGIAASRHAVALDPLNPSMRRHLGQSLFYARRYGEALAAYQEGVALDPDSATNHAFLGLAYYALGDLRNAQSSCEVKFNANLWIQFCLAVTYGKLGRPADAQAELKKLQARGGDAGAYQYASIYAQWGETAKALEWLAAAMRVRDSGLIELKTDPLLDPLRNEPRFQAIERELKFPD
jgi:TolB-like protein/DNA-binding winged helix-turn-helix (wHTH) protein/Flp pilus assembly protein TadD